MTKKLDVDCDDIVVEFPLFDTVSRSVRAHMTGNAKPPRSFLALNGVSIRIESGERIGVLGRNGAGKSTFLRTLAGVYPPCSGTLKVNTRLTSLFDIAVGVDLDASGYENIPLLMASRGISKSELENVIADVEEFTELGDALLRPVRTYSQGMRLRIAFAIATYHVEGLLLMDEIVGVGDKIFREKAQARLEKILGGEGSIVLATHSTELMKTHCERGIIFDKGKIVFDGELAEAVKQYNRPQA